MSLAFPPLQRRVWLQGRLRGGGAEEKGGEARVAAIAF